MRSMKVRAAAMVVAAGLLPAAAWGQSEGRQPGRPPNAPALSGPRSPSLGGPTVSVEFRGGTLGAFAEALRRSTDEPVNIALQGGAADLPVAPMSLRGVSVYAALRAALGDRVGQVGRGADGSQMWIGFETVNGGGDQDSPVFVVTGQVYGVEQSDQMVDVISIQRLIAGPEAMAPDVVLSAIDAGLAFQRDGRDARPEIRFHKDSGLLLVRGHPRDVDLVQRTVKRMLDDHQAAVAEAQQRKAMEIDRWARRQRTKVRLRLASDEVEAAERRHDLTRKALQSGQSSEMELMEAHLAVKRAKAEWEMLKIELEQIAEEERASVAPAQREGKPAERRPVEAGPDGPVEDIKKDEGRRGGGGPAGR